MTDNIDLDPLVPSWLTLTQTGERLGVTRSSVKRMLRENALVAVTRGERGEPQVPEPLVPAPDDESAGAGQVLPGLSGTLTLLFDAGFTSAEAVRWLFSTHDMLDEPPVEALAQSRPKVVHRAAQVAGF